MRGERDRRESARRPPRREGTRSVRPFARKNKANSLNIASGHRTYPSKKVEAVRNCTSLPEEGDTPAAAAARVLLPDSRNRPDYRRFFGTARREVLLAAALGGVAAEVGTTQIRNRPSWAISDRHSDPSTGRAGRLTSSAKSAAAVPVQRRRDRAAAAAADSACSTDSRSTCR